MIGVLGGLSLIVGLFSLIDTSTSTSFSVTYLVKVVHKQADQAGCISKELVCLLWIIQKICYNQNQYKDRSSGYGI